MGANWEKTLKKYERTISRALASRSCSETQRLNRSIQTLERRQLSAPLRYTLEIQYRADRLFARAALVQAKAKRCARRRG